MTRKYNLFIAPFVWVGAYLLAESNHPVFALTLLIIGLLNWTIGVFYKYDN